MIVNRLILYVLGRRRQTVNSPDGLLNTTKDQIDGHAHKNVRCRMSLDVEKLERRIRRIPMTVDDELLPSVFVLLCIAYLAETNEENKAFGRVERKRIRDDWKSTSSKSCMSPSRTCFPGLMSKPKQRSIANSRLLVSFPEFPTWCTVMHTLLSVSQRILK